MTFFFLVVGLEAKRELDLGELRERRRIAMPVVAALGGMTRAGADLPGLQRRRAPARTAGARRCRPTPRSRSACSRCWRRGRTRLRVFLLTLAVVDDLVALLVIATVYTEHVDFGAAADRGARAVRRAASRCATRRLGCGAGSPSWSASALWVALFKSGIDPVIAGLAVGLVTSAYPPSRARPRAGRRELTRSFREQPTPELARSAQLGVAVGDLAQRAPPVPPAPVDELRDRAALRARQRRRRTSTAACSATPLTRRSRSASSSATWSASRSASSARRGSRRAALLGGAPLPVSWPVLAAGGVVARDRLHGVAADLEHRVQRARSSTRRRSACSPRRSSRRSALGVARASSARLPAAVARAPAQRHRRRRCSTSPTTSTPTATTSAARTTRP